MSLSMLFCVLAYFGSPCSAESKGSMLRRPSSEGSKFGYSVMLAHKNGNSFSPLRSYTEDLHDIDGVITSFTQSMSGDGFVSLSIKPKVPIKANGGESYYGIEIFLPKKYAYMIQQYRVGDGINFNKNSAEVIDFIYRPN